MLRHVHAAGLWPILQTMRKYLDERLNVMDRVNGLRNQGALKISV